MRTETEMGVGVKVKVGHMCGH